MQSYCNSLTLCSKLRESQPLLPAPGSRQRIYGAGRGTHRSSPRIRTAHWPRWITASKNPAEGHVQDLRFQTNQTAPRSHWLLLRNLLGLVILELDVQAVLNPHLHLNGGVELWVSAQGVHNYVHLLHHIVQSAADGRAEEIPARRVPLLLAWYSSSRDKARRHMGLNGSGQSYWCPGFCSRQCPRMERQEAIFQRQSKLF